MAAVIVLVACSPEDGDKSSLGPLAVVEDPATGELMARGGSGPVDITDRCVTLQVSNADTFLLVWRSAEVAWDGERRQILFTAGAREDAGTLRIQDGDEIEVGGTTLFSSDEPAPTPEIDWVSPPDSNCGGELYIVHSVGLLP